MLTQPVVGVDRSSAVILRGDEHVRHVDVADVVQQEPSKDPEVVAPRRPDEGIHDERTTDQEVLKTVAVDVVKGLDVAAEADRRRVRDPEQGGPGGSHPQHGDAVRTREGLACVTDHSGAPSPSRSDDAIERIVTGSQRTRGGRRDPAVEERRRSPWTSGALSHARGRDLIAVVSQER